MMCVTHGKVDLRSAGVDFFALYVLLCHVTQSFEKVVVNCICR